MPSPHGSVLSLGILLMTVGGLMFLCVTQMLFWFGLGLILVGFFLLLLGVFMAMKSHHVAIPGHFLLHSRTGTSYSHNQAIIIQRRLDRIRRAVSEDRATSRPPPPSPGLQSVPVTPLPWTMEPPPSYETVMKSTLSDVQQP
ncbi:uncharacterized protein si:dkeyp-51f12.3 [Megalops cyprinoides]|uniref:uncharacterized protein si:dkeyp-51f12.3 n=1 Tax=Megalops cyprinoides TaxID=118141 RepID=UPI0018644BF1|nr:uncharacterized protein si:dkeyp-51f12.3 [Megalops cyprinoides]